jgi:hypothetical protein
MINKNLPSDIALSHTSMSNENPTYGKAKKKKKAISKAT